MTPQGAVKKPQQQLPPAATFGDDLPLYLRRASADLDWKLRFRIIAAKASRQNKNPESYTTSEAPIRDELVKMGFIEGESFLHEPGLWLSWQERTESILLA